MRVWRDQRWGTLALEWADPEEIRFGGRTPVGPTLLSVPIFAALIVVAWGGPSLTPARLTTGIVLLVASLVLGVWAWPVKRSVRIRLGDGTVDDGATLRRLDAATCIELRSGERIASSAPPSYRASLVFKDGSRVRLLQSPEPAGVLQSLTAVVHQIGLPVRSGWRLPPKAEPWQPGSSTVQRRPGADEEGATVGSSLQPWTVRVPLQPNQYSVALALLISAIMVGVIVTFMFLSRLEEGKSISALSVWLAVPLVAILLLLCGWMYLYHVRFTLGRSLVVQRRVLALTLQVRLVPSEHIRQAYAVGPEHGNAWHLLIRARDEWLAFPCAGNLADELARRLNGENGELLHA